MARKYKRDSRGRFAGGSGGAGGSRMSASARGARSVARVTRRHKAAGALGRTLKRGAKSPAVRTAAFTGLYVAATASAGRSAGLKAPTRSTKPNAFASTLTAGTPRLNNMARGKRTFVSGSSGTFVSFR